MWITEGLRPTPPQGDIITLQAKAQNGESTAADQWSEIQLDWDETLPNGTYAVVGSEHISPTALVHRWIFDNQHFRPGGLSQIDLGNRTHRIFYDGILGTWGTFTAQVLPRLEVFATGVDTSHDIFLQVIRIGD